MGDTFQAQRISGGYVSQQDTSDHLSEIVYSVGKDGLPYVWTDG